MPGLKPTIKAINAGKDDCAWQIRKHLVVAGEMITQTGTKAKGVNIYPVDSEHSAIFQCLGWRISEPYRKNIPDGIRRPLQRTKQAGFSIGIAKRTGPETS